MSWDWGVGGLSQVRGQPVLPKMSYSHQPGLDSEVLKWGAVAHDLESSRGRQILSCQGHPGLHGETVYQKQTERKQALFYYCPAWCPWRILNKPASFLSKHTQNKTKSLQKRTQYQVPNYFLIPSFLLEKESMQTTIVGITNHFLQTKFKARLDHTHLQSQYLDLET